MRYRNPAPNVIRRIDIVTLRQRARRGTIGPPAELVPDVWLENMG
jgi:hypothetical protein